MKYRKKPVVIEAEQCWYDKKPWPDGVEENIKIDEDGAEYEAVPFIETLEGRLTVGDGDWIITGVKGEKYPCKPDIFEQTYEFVEV